MGKKIGKMEVGEREGTKIHRARHKEQVEEPALWPRGGADEGKCRRPQGRGPCLPAHHQPEGLVGSFHQGNGLPSGAAQRDLIDVHHLIPGLQSGAHQGRFAPFLNLSGEMREPCVRTSAAATPGGCCLSSTVLQTPAPAWPRRRSETSSWDEPTQCPPKSH